ncbi:MAG: hypothetical protein RE472_01020 [Thermoplasmatales archaeon]|nr:MAG: hypothetical protein RE472_01020 [Thermoplasmatales archaeon]
MILKRQSKNRNGGIKKHVKYISNGGKVKEFLSENNVGNKIRVCDLIKKIGVTSLTRVLWVLKMDGFIDYEMQDSGRTSYLTILRTL